jgi:hypothetical protein
MDSGQIVSERIKNPNCVALKDVLFYDDGLSSSFEFCVLITTLSALVPCLSLGVRPLTSCFINGPYAYVVPENPGC